MFSFFSEIATSGNGMKWPESPAGNGDKEEDAAKESQGTVSTDKAFRRCRISPRDRTRLVILARDNEMIT